MAEKSFTNFRVELPWPEEREQINSLVKKPGGNWVVAAACIDYAYLSGIAIYARAAFGPGSMQIDREERIASATNYHRLLEAEENKKILNEVVGKATELSQEVPREERDFLIEEGDFFIATTAGHVAVNHLVATAKMLNS